jgi:hypothetical protein
MFWDRSRWDRPVAVVPEKLRNHDPFSERVRSSMKAALLIVAVGLASMVAATPGVSASQGCPGRQVSPNTAA